MKRLQKLLVQALLPVNEHEGEIAQRKFFYELKKSGADPHTLSITTRAENIATRADNITEGFSFAAAYAKAKEREAESRRFDDAVDAAYAKALEKRGWAPDPPRGQWSAVQGVDPWLADDDPLWAPWAEKAEREAERRAKQAQALEEKAKQEAERLAEQARAREEAAKREAEREAEARRTFDDRVNREVNNRIAARCADEKLRDDFEAAVTLFRNRAQLNSVDRCVVERIYRAAHSASWESPLRCFRLFVTDDALATSRDIASKAMQRNKCFILRLQLGGVRWCNSTLDGIRRL
jgi:hypothetical protein